VNLEVDVIAKYVEALLDPIEGQMDGRMEGQMEGKTP
jgi:riboflavin synthase alpha subunit